MRLINKIRTLALVALVALAGAHTLAGPDRQSAVEKAAAKVVAKYQAAPAAEVVAQLKADLSRVKAAKDPSKVEARIRKEFPGFVLEDAELAVEGVPFNKRVWEIIEPAFQFSGKEKTYRLLVLKTVDPVAFVDDGCVVVISTGLLMAANAEDALVGLVAHEQAHSLFAERMAEARRQLEHAQQQANPVLEQQALDRINLIEYECDAVTAVQLSATGYNPLRYLDLLDSAGVGVRIVGNTAHFQSSSGSPEHDARKFVVTRLATPEAVNVLRPTNRLLPLQAAVRRARGEK